MTLAAGLVLAPLSARAAPNDPAWLYQWGMVQVRAEQAWKVSRGGGAVVAVIDTGVDSTHPDLQRQVLAGKDFVDDDGTTQDANGHGTLIAGIIAASTGNGIGIASVAPDAVILPVRVLGPDGTGTSDDVAAGIAWAVEHGAGVINLSLAQDKPGSPALAENLFRDPAVDRAIRDAAAAGSTVLVAAGNSDDGGRSETAYDARVPGVIVVGAVARDGRRAAYSNYGPGLDVVAPGGGSATDPSRAACDEHNGIVSTWWNSSTDESVYGAGCGTSMAVAFASGVAALLDARGLSNEQIVARIVGSARDLGPAGWDDETGAGRIDAARALGVRASPAAVRPSSTAAPPSVRSAGNAAGVAGPSPVRSPPPTPPPVTSAMGTPKPMSHVPREGVAVLATVLAAAVTAGHLWRLRSRARARRQAPA